MIWHSFTNIYFNSSSSSIGISFLSSSSSMFYKYQRRTDSASQEVNTNILSYSEREQMHNTFSVHYEEKNKQRTTDIYQVKLEKHLLLCRECTKGLFNCSQLILWLWIFNEWKRNPWHWVKTVYSHISCWYKHKTTQRQTVCDLTLIFYQITRKNNTFVLFISYFVLFCNSIWVAYSAA